MIISIKRNILNNKFETVLAFKEYGTSDYTPEQEQALVENYPQSLSYRDIVFSADFKVDENNDVQLAQDGDLDVETVTLTIPQRLIPVDETFQAKYTIAKSDVSDSEIGTILSTKALICQAKVKLFENAVSKKLTDILDELRAKDNNFESESPIEITV